MIIVHDNKLIVFPLNTMSILKDQGGRTSLFIGLIVSTESFPSSAWLCFKVPEDEVRMIERSHFDFCTQPTALAVQRSLIESRYDSTSFLLLLRILLDFFQKIVIRRAGI